MIFARRMKWTPVGLLFCLSDNEALHANPIISGGIQIYCQPVIFFCSVMLICSLISSNLVRRYCRTGANCGWIPSPGYASWHTEGDQTAGELCRLDSTIIAYTTCHLPATAVHDPKQTSLNRQSYFVYIPTHPDRSKEFLLAGSSQCGCTLNPVTPVFRSSSYNMKNIRLWVVFIVLA